MNPKIDNIIVHDENNIKGFFYEYRWLSNFHLCPVEYGGYVFPSSENAYQCIKMKIGDLNQPYTITDFVAATPNEAKKMGQKVILRDDWERVKTFKMWMILNEKFSQNPDLTEKLLATGTKYLEETNYWKDTFLGVCNGIGENRLGKILMNMREEFKND